MSGPGPVRVALTFALLCSIWGTTWSVIQIGLAGIPPFSGVALRFAIAAVVLLALAFARGIRLGTSRHERVLWVVNALCTFILAYGIVYWSEQWVPSGLSAVLFATYPFFVAVLGHFLLPSERLTGREVLGTAIGFSGVGVIFSEDLAALGGPEMTRAAAILLLSPLCSATGSVVVKRWGGDVHPLSISAVPMAITAVVMGAVALGLERDRIFSWDAVSVGALLYLALLGSALTFSLYFWLLSHQPAKRVALIAYVIPVVAVLVGTLRGERLTSRTLAGSALVVAGVALAVQRWREKGTDLFSD